MNFFLYHRSVSVTGRLLAKALGTPYGHLGAGQTPRRVRRIQSDLIRTESIIRWGSQQALPSGCQPERSLNTVSALSTASDKLSTLRTLERAGVRVPSFALDATTALELFTTTDTVLGRSRTGMRGRDIRVFRQGETPAGCAFYTAYVPNTREYRIHVFKGEVIRVQGKYLDFPDQHTNPYIKNHGQGYRFRTPDRQLNSDRLEAATAAVGALGLDFGAVDLLVGEDRLCYVLEVNTAPACSPLTARAYIEKFAEWLGVEPNYEALASTDEQRPARAPVLALSGVAGR